MLNDVLGSTGWGGGTSNGDLYNEREGEAS